MKHKKETWFERIIGFFHRSDQHHRVCWRCRKRIGIHEHWHQAKVGWFAPYYTVEHRNCKNPRAETSYEIAQRLGPEWPKAEVAEEKR